MDESLKQYMTEVAEWISANLVATIPQDTPKQLLDSMQYSLLAGGKRIRPILLIATLEALGKERQLGLEAALAIEMIHTYSLIHDDLPAMDNDDFRRGKPTNHKVFGEGIAILAGDALLTWAFHLMSSIAKRHSVDPLIVLDLVSNLAIAAGPSGMVGGQVLDLEGENQNLNLEQLEKIHRHKTGDMIHFSIYAGAKLGNANEEQLLALSTYARKLGLAFQIKDDILDVIGNEELIGKPVGSDQRLGKSTYPALMGLENAKKSLETLIDEAIDALKVPGIEYERLVAIANYFKDRES